MSGIADGIASIAEKILNLPALILNGLKEIFVPDTAVIKAEFDNLMTSLKGKLGIDVYDLDNLFSASSAPTDIESSYDGGLWSYSGKFVDFSFLVQGVEYFRKYIRGFIVLLLVFFNIRQALSMFGLSSGEIASASEGGKKE